MTTTPAFGRVSVAKRCPSRADPQPTPTASIYCSRRSFGSSACRGRPHLAPQLALAEQLLKRAHGIDGGALTDGGGLEIAAPNSVPRFSEFTRTVLVWLKPI
jgi:hypothetical protein